MVLTGGRIAAAVYRAVRDSPARDAVDWSRVDFWWGDERFLPAGHPERNETQARAALLDALPVDPARVHPMPPSDGPDGADPEAAAARYADELAAAAPGHRRAAPLRLVLLGVGEDGHVASVFPEHPVAYETRPVAAVRGSPSRRRCGSRSPCRRSTRPRRCGCWRRARRRRTRCGMALAGAGAVQLPAAGVHGCGRTLWLLDRAAAHEVPPRFRSPR